MEAGSTRVVLSLYRSAPDDSAFAFVWQDKAFTVQGHGDEICVVYSELMSPDAPGQEGTLPIYTSSCQAWDEPKAGLKVPGSDGQLVWGLSK